MASLCAFVDSCIFVRVATQGRPGCELSHFENLKTMVEGGALDLVVPEVSLLELERQQRTIPDEIVKKCDVLRVEVEKCTKQIWNEVESLRSHLLGAIEKHKTERVATFRRVMESILDYLRSEAAWTVPLTTELMLAAQRLLMTGALNRNGKRHDQDAMAVASLVHFAKEHPDIAYLFCSENTRDFATEINSKAKDRQFKANEQISDILSCRGFFTSLEELLVFGRGYEDVRPADPPVEQAEAIDLDTDEGKVQLAKAIELDAILGRKNFQDVILPHIPEETKRYREEVIRDIEGQLRWCRQCKSWDEQSEDKLPEWMEWVPEAMLPYTSVWKLAKIRGNLGRYLETHEKMDADMLKMLRG